MPTDEVTQILVKIDKIQADALLALTASEQRGYDRAIAEVVAVMRDVVRSFQDGEGYFLAGQIRIRLDEFEAHAIEAGEHKP